MDEGYSEGLTTPQRETTEHRLFQRHPSVLSRGEGSPQLKGKGVGPTKWGNANFSEDNVGLEAQRAALVPWSCPRVDVHLEWIDARGWESHSFKGIQSLCKNFRYKDDDLGAQLVVFQFENVFILDYG